MKHRTTLAVLLTMSGGLAVLHGDARARLAQQNAPGASKSRGGKRDGVVRLRTPGPARILIRSAVFRMGSDIPEVATAQAQCRHEPLKRACNTRMFTDETVQHTVKVNDFWLDRTEVTTRAYRRCVDAGVCKTPGYGAASSWTSKPKDPVTLVSWFDAQRFCSWVGGRLPTEAEWERAARGLAQRTYPWGNVFNRKLCNHGRFAAHPLDGRDGFKELAPVNSFPQGRTKEGVYNLVGNVEEWVGDWYAPGYPEMDVVDPIGPGSGDERVIRGGNFRTGKPWLRNATRFQDIPSARRAWRGFRCAYPVKRKPLPPKPAD